MPEGLIYLIMKISEEVGSMRWVLEENYKEARKKCWYLNTEEFKEKLEYLEFAWCL